MPHDVSYGSNKKRWWRCKDGHEWEAVVNSRTIAGNGCPRCSGRIPSDAKRLSIRNPDVADEWHPTKNGSLTPHDVSYGSNKEVWWRCKDGHEWDARVSARTRQKQGCPDCKGKRVTDRNRLSLRCPEVAAEWHPTKNEGLTPGQVTASSSKTVWWICEKGDDHEWDDTVNHRTSERGCPFCAGKRISDTNRLSRRYPELAAEWHPTKNGDLTADGVTFGSNKKVWWRCSRDHEWEAVVSSRTGQGVGCSQCTSQGRSGVEIYLACELKAVFHDIDPRDTPRVASHNVDIKIPSEKLVLEYDGHHWHKSRDSHDRDAGKTEILKARGWTVIRIRERPLERIQPHDLLLTFKPNNEVKRLADEVLRHIEKVLNKNIPGVDEYLRRRTLANRKLAKEIIDGPPAPSNQSGLFDE